jgi:hypothetical protein
MRLKRSTLRFEPGSHALRLEHGGQGASSLGPLAKLQPGHAHETPALERLELCQLEVETTQRKPIQPICDAVHDQALDRPDEADGQMQV